jgi:hypothetical protein
MSWVARMGKRAEIASPFVAGEERGALPGQSAPGVPGGPLADGSNPRPHEPAPPLAASIAARDTRAARPLGNEPPAAPLTPLGRVAHGAITLSGS